MKSEKIKRWFFDGVMGAYLFLALQVKVLYPIVGNIFSLWVDDEANHLRLNYAVIWFVIWFVISVGISSLLKILDQESLGAMIFRSAKEKAQKAASGQTASSQFWFWQLMVFLLVTLLLSIDVTQFSVSALLDYDGFQGVLRLLGGLATPNWELLPKAVYAIVVTIFMAFLATFLAIPLAFVLSFFSAKNMMQSPVAFAIYTLLRTSFNVIRSIEALIWAIIFSVWVGIGPFAGMLALMVHSVASLAKQYSEIIETVSDGPIEGILSTGANRLQMVWFAIVPQVLLPFISFTIYRWDINIRMATIIGLVGGGGIGTLFMQYSGQAMWHEVGTIVLVIAFVVWFMDTASAYLREALK